MHDVEWRQDVHVAGVDVTAMDTQIIDRDQGKLIQVDERLLWDRRFRWSVRIVQAGGVDRNRTAFMIFILPMVVGLIIVRTAVTIAFGFIDGKGHTGMVCRITGIRFVGCQDRC